MLSDDPRAAYLALAHNLDQRQIEEAAFPSHVASLPPLDHALYHQLESRLLETIHAQPRFAWALAAVVESAAARHAAQGAAHRRLQALAAFNVARAANAWLQPQRVWQAAQRARALFSALGEEGWVAACDWQSVAVPWASNDFRGAARTLQRALERMQAPELSRWQFECRLSLAFAHILLTEYDAALAHLELCENQYRATGDNLGLARTLTRKAACLRRVGNFEDSLVATSEAMQLLDGAGWPLDRARAKFQLGHTLHLQGVHYAPAEEALQEALQAFGQADVELWAAQCHYALARVYRETGRIALAEQALRQARRTFRRYPILGLRADALLDSAVFALRLGRHQRALNYVDEAEPLYDRLQVHNLAAMCNIYRGEIYAELDRYQLALHYLELGYHRLRELDVLDRVAEAALRLGETWLWLQRPDNALAYLQEAAAYYEEAGHSSFLAETYALLTAARLANGDDVSQIIAAAESALQRLEPHGVQPYLALLQRYIGEACLASGRLQQAISHLQAAIQKFRAMSMNVEVAECQLPLGHSYLALSRPRQAAQAWRKALSLTQGSLPAISWQAHDGLARLDAAGGQTEAALEHYTHMIAAFSRLRRGFWQPSLAGAYLNRSAQALDRAVDFAGAHHSSRLQQFVEESKAQTTARRLQQPATVRMHPEQQPLAGEIRWLQQKIASARHSGASPAALLQLESDLVARVQQYETLASRNERQTRRDGAETAVQERFDAAAFRRAATNAFGDRWLAVDYYLTDSALACITLMPGESHTTYAPLNTTIARALTLASRPALDVAAAPDHLAVLARWLLPQPLLTNLTPDATLIISPHRKLHRLPWAALPCPYAGGVEPLAGRCAPLLIPSLHTFTLLAQRERPSQALHSGLVVAVSEFAGRRPPLPAVREEAVTLAAQMGAHGRLLTGEQATWDALAAISGDGGLASYAFLHIASHAFFDNVTGRASGLALYDRNVWLDELWDVAPLPALVSLSACSGMQSYVVEGDEHISLPTTCLQAGAAHVMGSLWRVRDEEVPLISTAFYQQFLQGAHPAQALARAQRQALAAGVPWSAWAPFICMGAP